MASMPLIFVMFSNIVLHCVFVDLLMIVKSFVRIFDEIMFQHKNESVSYLAQDGEKRLSCYNFFAMETKKCRIIL